MIWAISGAGGYGMTKNQDVLFPSTSLKLIQDVLGSFFWGYVLDESAWMNYSLRVKLIMLLSFCIHIFKSSGCSEQPRV